MLRKSFVSFFVFGSLFLTGCSSLPFSEHLTLDKEQRAKNNEKKQLAAIAARPEVPPSTLLNAGITNINQGRSKSAQKAFGALNNQHPFSKEAQQSLILSAYTHFTEKEYNDSVAKAQQFIQLYPGSNDAAYMQYLIGESYYNQVNAVVLDQSETAKGLRAYKDLVRLYPESKYTPDARGKILFMEDQLAGKEMQIGRYYQERHQHLAAINRFKGVVETYDKTRHIEEALFRLTESYLAIGIVNDAKESASLLGHNFPDSEWYQAAYRLLTGEKVKPNKVAKKKNKKKQDVTESVASVANEQPVDILPPVEAAVEQKAEVQDSANEAIAVQDLAPVEAAAPAIEEEKEEKKGVFSRLNPFGVKKNKEESL